MPTRFAGLVAVLFGLATLSYTRHPEGFLDFLSGRVQAAIAERRTRRLGGRAAARWTRDGGAGRAGAPAGGRGAG